MALKTASSEKTHAPALFKTHLSTLKRNTYFQMMHEHIYQHSITSMPLYVDIVFSIVWSLYTEVKEKTNTWFLIYSNICPI